MLRCRSCPHSTHVAQRRIRSCAEDCSTGVPCCFEALDSTSIEVAHQLVWRLVVFSSSWSIRRQPSVWHSMSKPWQKRGPCHSQQSAAHHAGWALRNWIQRHQLKPLLIDLPKPPPSCHQSSSTASELPDERAPGLHSLHFCEHPLLNYHIQRRAVVHPVPATESFSCRFR